MSGVSTCCKALLDDRCKIFGAEPLNANDAQRSLKSGTLIENERPPKTICDGLLTNMKDKTWNIIRYVPLVSMTELKDITYLISLQ
jgi:threonine dehydratase